MIHRFRFIGNVGRFETFSSASGDNLELQPLTLVWGENGLGKTTISAILRSFANDDPAAILGRQSLGSGQPPKVVLEVDASGSTAVFENGTWSQTNSDIFVFDDQFIHENIHSGLTVESSHRQNLHEVIIGRRGVELARRVEELTKEISERHNVLKEREAAIQPDVRGDLTVDAFCALDPIPNIDAEISGAETTVQALRQADQVRSMPAFDEFPIDPIDVGSLRELLARGLPEIDESAVRTVRAHFDSIGPDGETWVADGVVHLESISDDDDEICPFCGQSLSGLDLIDAYRGYFGEAYRNHKEQIARLKRTIESQLSENKLATIQRAIQEARRRRDFWNGLHSIPEIDLDIDNLAQIWREAQSHAGRLLSVKTGAPLETITIDADAQKAFDALAALSVDISEENAVLQGENAVIARIKNDIAGGDLPSSEAKLRRLKTTKARFHPENISLCDAYLEAKQTKAEAESRKVTDKAALDDHREQVLEDYEQTINGILRRFNAGFSIGSIEATHARGNPSSKYSVIINRKEVKVDGGRHSGTRPEFGNTLSSGDRNTLALAFFFAQLQAEPGLNDFVVILDDPVSSLDEGRTRMTAEIVEEMRRQTAQMIVMSHRRDLLREVQRRALRLSTPACLRVVQSTSGSSIEPWSIEDESEDIHRRRHQGLQDYLSGSSQDSEFVAVSLRHILERFVRTAYPEHADESTLLGAFRNKAQTILNNATGDPILNQTDIDELRELTDYANQFHHDNPDYQTNLRNITRAELVSYANRVLTFTRRPQ